MTNPYQPPEEAGAPSPNPNRRAGVMEIWSPAFFVFLTLLYLFVVSMAVYEWLRVPSGYGGNTKTIRMFQASYARTGLIALTFALSSIATVISIGRRPVLARYLGAFSLGGILLWLLGTV